MYHPSRKHLWLLVQFVAFQAAWFACVLGAARGTPWIGMAAVALVWGSQIAFSPARCQDIILALTAAALGLLWDTAMLRTGVVVYASPGPVSDWAPGWIWALWILLSTILREPLRWLHGRSLLSALVGGVGGALSYWSAVRLGAGTFDNLSRALLVLGAGWAIITPALTEFARWLAARQIRCGRTARS